MAAKRTIEINGKTYNKCHISRKQWKECSTPCMYCDLQAECDIHNPFCCNEHVCYIELDAVYGEDRD